MIKLGILGVGKMGGSILKGVLESKKYTVNDIEIYTPNEAHKAKYTDMGIRVVESESELFKTAETIILGIKPQMYAEALEYAKGNDYSKQCVISLAPGKSIDYLKSVFTNATVVRVMPNTPAVLQKATTTMVKSADNELSKNAKEVFESIGTVDELPTEAQIDEAIPLNGSMPAYLYLFAKAFIENGIKHGIDPETAKSLACNAIIGSANMILESTDSIDTLINNVCSKKGTTIEGLERLYDNGFEDAIKECYDACVRRSKELSGN